MRIISALVIFSFLSSCSIKEMAVEQVAPMLSSASPELQKERNWHQFKIATPASLQLSEVLLANDPDNRDLHALLTKGFASYAYVVNDTEYLADRYAEVDDSMHREQAIMNLSKALKYGFAYMALADLDYSRLQKASKDGSLNKLLDDKLDPKDNLDLETVFFTGTAWLLSANYQKDNMVIVSQATQAFELIQWVCKREPTFQNGLCDTMVAVFHLARPPMMGGKPDLAKTIFLAAMKKFPDNFLIPVTYLEWFVVPRADEDNYKAIKTNLSEQVSAWKKASYVPGEENKSSAGSLVDLFNAMAAERLEIMNKYEKELF